MIDRPQDFDVENVYLPTISLILNPSWALTINSLVDHLTIILAPAPSRTPFPLHWCWSLPG